MWLLLCGKLPTSSLLQSRHILSNTSCKTCSHPYEDLTHIFLQCPLGLQLWRHLNLSPPTDNYSSWIRTLCTSRYFIPLARNLLVPLSTLSPIVLWNIWLTSNHNVFHNTTLSVSIQNIITNVTELLYLTPMPPQPPPHITLLVP